LHEQLKRYRLAINGNAITSPQPPKSHVSPMKEKIEVSSLVVNYSDDFQDKSTLEVKSSTAIKTKAISRQPIFSFSALSSQNSAGSDSVDQQPQPEPIKVNLPLQSENENTLLQSPSKKWIKIKASCINWGKIVPKTLLKPKEVITM